MYTGLTDEFFSHEASDDEDITAGRNKTRERRTVKPVHTFQDEYGYYAKRTKTTATKTPQPSSTLCVDRNMPIAAAADIPMMPNASRSFSTTQQTTSRSLLFPCPVCKELFALRADGRTLQKHGICGSLQIF